jgi:cell division protein FtsB
MGLETGTIHASPRKNVRAKVIGYVLVALLLICSLHSVVAVFWAGVMLLITVSISWTFQKLEQLRRQCGISRLEGRLMKVLLLFAMLIWVALSVWIEWSAAMFLYLVSLIWVWWTASKIWRYDLQI